MLTLTLDFGSDSGIPIYRQVADGLRGLIADGRLAPGEALPGVRQLGRTLGVNLNTVARAYRLLAKDGLIDLRRGAAARVIGPAPDTRAIDDDDARRLEAALAHLALAGVDRGSIEALVADVLDRFDAGRASDDIRPTATPDKAGPR